MTPKQALTVDIENRLLLSLLTALLAAVSQQFIHILLLRKNGEEQLVTQFREIDDNDFKNAMQIIDLLISRGVPIEIDKHVVAPGMSKSSILRSELKMELHLHEVTQKTEVSSSEGKAILTRALMLRENYREWLAHEIGLLPEEFSSTEDFTEKPGLFSLLLLLMEQSLVHAFTEWHKGGKKEADTAWQISGAAMLYITALAEFYGSEVSGSGSITIPRSVVDKTTDLFQSDITLVRECAEAACHLQRETDDHKLSELSKRIAEDCDNVARTQRGKSIEAALGKSEVFRKFSRAHKRMNS